MTGRLEELADGVYAWVHDVRDRFTCNVGVIVEDDGISLVDTSGRPDSYDALAEAIAVFGQPVTAIHLTHPHGDHVAGTVRFPGARVLAGAATADALTQPPPTPVLQRLHPTITDELAGLSHPAVTSVVTGSCSVGRLEIEVLAGHTGSDLVVHVPDADLVFAGDLCFFDHVPLGIGADFARWSASVGVLAAVGRHRVVPGHGPVGGPAELAVVDAYLQAVREAAEQPAGRVRPGPWSSWWDPWADRIPGAIDRINVEQARSPGGYPPTLIELIS